MGFLCYYLKAVFRRITKMILFKIRFPPSNLVDSVYKSQEIIMGKKTSKHKIWMNLAFPSWAGVFVCIWPPAAKSPGMHVWEMSEISWDTLAHVQVVSSYLCDCLCLLYIHWIELKVKMVALENTCYKVTSIPGAGRGLVATRDIAKGDLILSDGAAVTGPCSR